MPCGRRRTQPPPGIPILIVNFVLLYDWGTPAVKLVDLLYNYIVIAVIKKTRPVRRAHADTFVGAWVQTRMVSAVQVKNAQCVIAVCAFSRWCCAAGCFRPRLFFPDMFEAIV